MIHLTLTPAQNNWLEATWLDVEQLPDVVTPAKPALYDDDGKEVQPATPETTTHGGKNRTELKHTSYHPTQLDLLQSDAAAMGTSLDAHAHMLNEWVAAYVPPEPEPTPVPQVVTIRQARLALLAANLLDDVDATVALSERSTQIEWEYATEVRRDHPLIQAIQVSNGLTSLEIDHLFISAANM